LKPNSDLKRRKFLERKDDMVYANASPDTERGQGECLGNSSGGCEEARAGSVKKLKARIFTLDEANAMIPELESRMSCLMLKRELHTRTHDALLLHELLREAEKKTGLSQNGALGLDEEVAVLERDLEEIQKRIREIREMGCVLSDLENGRVEFLARKGTEWIYFCWQCGEREIKRYRFAADKNRQRFSLAPETSN